jgi:AAA family ATP:ADP antiporter
MLFTVVDQESKYKAKNVIDTVVYRGGDLVASFASVAVLNGYGDIGLAVLGVIVSLFWFPIAWVLGRRSESARSAEGVNAVPVTVGH